MTWASFRLPAPTHEDYAIASDFGLVRTPFDDGGVRQRRRWYAGPVRTVRLVWVLPEDALQTLELWLDAYGWDWHTQPLISGAGDGPDLTDQDTRLTSDLDVEWIGSGVVRVSASAEVRAP